jgi:NADH:ubiquinone oxidoreductase subunit K
MMPYVFFILFLIGLSGLFVFRNNFIILLMSIELVLFSINLLSAFFSFFLDDAQGQLFTLFVLTVAAAESAIGLGLLVMYYRFRGLITVEFIDSLKGLV